MNTRNCIERAQILKKLRAFFDARGFIETETPVRIAAPAPEPHIDCPPVATGGFLRASPELQMKKLMAAGLERIYQVGPCFREGEKGTRHNPEFTMLEWYRAGADYTALKADAENLFHALTAPLGRGGRPRPPAAAPFQSLTVRAAYRTWAGWDPWTDWNQDRFDFDMATKIEPALPAGGVFLMDYPPQAASLARIVEKDGVAVAERWELYFDGMELANCFSELCEGAEQRRRFAAAKAERQALNESDYPLDEGFLEALDAIGSAAGAALGFDRLVMVLTGAKSIDEVRMT